MVAFVHEEEDLDIPVKYLSIRHLYHPPSSVFSAAVGSSMVVSKKVQARLLVGEEDDEAAAAEKDDDGKGMKPPAARWRRELGEEKPLLVYHRRRKKHCPSSSNGSLPRVSRPDRVEPQEQSVDSDGCEVVAEECGQLAMPSTSACGVRVSTKRKRQDPRSLRCSGDRVRKSSRFGETGSSDKIKYFVRKRLSLSGRKDTLLIHKQDKSVKRWLELVVDGADPQAFLCLPCKVFWPIDDDWYKGVVRSFDPESKRHQIVYDDGDMEELILSDESVKFNVSPDDLHRLNLKCRISNADKNELKFDEMLSLAISTADCEVLQPGDIVWVKITGHAMWPAVIVNESSVNRGRDLKPHKGNQPILAQFFGTHDFARVNPKQAVPFLDGLLSSLHLKCTQARFFRSLDEARIYLKKNELPKRMLKLRNGKGCNGSLDDDSEEINPVEGDSGNEIVLKRSESNTVGALDGLQVESVSASKMNNQDFSSCHQSSKLPRSCSVPVGYRAVHVGWKDLDRCSVCHMDEEYEDNLFLQCEKCRIMVHAKCYGEVEPLDGFLWLCNLCRPGAPEVPPSCCLCPITGGVMKPTTDGRWAHLACAMWIPETCLVDVKRMEPIDGICKINKDRWKLLCCICGVSFGACIQCSNKTCRVAYHPLCARVAGLCVELEDEDNLHLMLLHEDDDCCIRLFSFCKKHRQPSAKPLSPDESCTPFAGGSSCTSTTSLSGCARSESYEFYGKSLKKESQTSSSALTRRCFVENTPYLVAGCRQNMIGSFSYNEPMKFLGLFGASKFTPLSKSFERMSEKYLSMKGTFKKRLTFGKSAIHGFGVFAKVAHRAGDMVIEYTGELVRSTIADAREHTIYNALVGAGTYMFRIDDECVVDATRAGSMAHLINHSCEPNCFSRMINVCDGQHIIIFAKRDICQWEELTYDYRYFSIDKQLACNCGFPRCRGVVNDADADEHVTKVRVPLSDVSRDH